MEHRPGGELHRLVAECGASFSGLDDDDFVFFFVQMNRNHGSRRDVLGDHREPSALRRTHLDAHRIARAADIDQLTLAGVARKGRQWVAAGADGAP
jgi:hypothetical protein